MKKATLNTADSFTMPEASQRPSLLYTHDGLPVFIGDMFGGRSAFLICGGPSFASIDQSLLAQPGVLTMALNNAVSTFRPNLWTCVDSPQNFIRSIWVDPTITKFVPVEHARTKLFDNEEWKELDLTTAECPNTFFYMRNLEFDPSVFLEEPTVNWGAAAFQGGARSVMLVAMRLLYHLGVRDVFLLGADFNMSSRKRYHFAQERTKASIQSNQYTYAMLIDRFSQLKEVFEERGFCVYNCNPRSKLEVFPYVPFPKAIRYALRDMPLNVNDERTEGLYDRNAKENARLRSSVEEGDTKRLVSVVRFPNLVAGPGVRAGAHGEGDLGAIVMVVDNRNGDFVKSWWSDCPPQDSVPVIFVNNGMSKRMAQWCRHRGRVISVSGVPWRPEPFAIAQAGVSRALVLDPCWRGDAVGVLKMVLPAVALETYGVQKSSNKWPVTFTGRVIGSGPKNRFVEEMCERAVAGERDITNLVNHAAYESRMPLIPLATCED